jgi:hypothetical protein
MSENNNTYFALANLGAGLSGVQVCVLRWVVVVSLACWLAAIGLCWPPVKR